MKTLVKVRGKKENKKQEKKALSVTDELRVIAERNDGVLMPKHVVTYARNATTALHGCFEWDDGKAAEAHRMEQARHIIRVRFADVPVLDGDTQILVREYVHLSADDVGVYRRVEDVVGSKTQRVVMLEDAKRDLRAFRDKYILLAELAGVRKEIDKVLGER